MTAIQADHVLVVLWLILASQVRMPTLRNACLVIASWGAVIIIFRTFSTIA